MTELNMPDMPDEYQSLQHEIVECQICPRLTLHRQQVAGKKRRAYADWDYWGKPVPSLGEPDARLLIVGLAPGAHGSNRTGRMFTGDKSGELLFDTLWRFGFCNQPSSLHREDGLRLQETYITAAIHCVPPQNRPATDELANCRHYLRRELQLLTNVKVAVALGSIGWQGLLLALGELGLSIPRPRPAFGHLASCEIAGKITLIGCYHPSQQNTQTGRLTPEMFSAVFARARELLG